MPDTLDLAMSLLDRLVVDIKGEPLGRVDDIEFTELDADSPPRITALLCGPLALGPRLGHKWGDVWASAGRRLRGTTSDEPARIPWALVKDLAPGEVRLGIPEAEAMTMALEVWTEEHIIGLIPGSGD
jgi:sporulation protein YlmC with PRC-barrel domain